jgi:D-amino-acid dehydrogenase
MNLRQHPRRVSMLTEGAADYLPQVRHAPVISTWCGLRPCTADGLPVIGPDTRWRNLYIATGHAKMGLSLGPITGRLLAEWILDGRPSFDLSLMSPARFA